MTRDEWLRSHAFLAPVARFLGQVDDALAGISAHAPASPSSAPAAPSSAPAAPSSAAAAPSSAAAAPSSAAAAPSWDDYAADYAAGVPLLRSTNAAVELEPAGAMALALIDRLAAGTASDTLSADARKLGAELQRQPRPTQCVVDWLLGEAEFEPSSPGLLRYLGWAALARCLRPVLDAFALWRNEERWLRGYCPACGAAPAMAQLVGADAERKRLLACGCCGSRWHHRRTACPFCATDSQRIGIVQIQSEGRADGKADGKPEGGLRIDYCEACKGYLKTYDGHGQEALLLADWTSLHLDVIARDRGLERRAESLFDLGALLPPQQPGDGGRVP